MKQRSKDELIKHYMVYKGMKQEESSGDNKRFTITYTRNAVEWAKVLTEIENFSAKDMQRIFTYVLSQDLENFPDERVKEIQQRMLDKGCLWTFGYRNLGLSNKKDEFNRYTAWQIYYNTKVSVNYGLLVLEYLMDYKRFGKKRLDRVIQHMLFLEKFTLMSLLDWRRELYDSKGLWIQFDADEVPPEGAEVVNGDETDTRS